jgi:hypothetical protein
VLNLPAGSDIRKMREQLSRMERELARLRKELEDGDAGRQRSQPKRADTTE